jgi:hypothetical protein
LKSLIFPEEFTKEDDYPIWNSPIAEFFELSKTKSRRAAKLGEMRFCGVFFIERGPKARGERFVGTSRFLKFSDPWI